MGLLKSKNGESNSYSNKWFWRIVLVSLIFSICIATIFFLNRLHVSRIYFLKASFVHMPLTDKRLEEWVKVQPGVIAHTVQFQREGHWLRVSFTISQNLFNSPPVPDLSSVSDSMGYKTSTEWVDDMSN
jgi:magnesium-transporting ATPase (P-type)